MTEELQVLLEQLDELLGEGAQDEEDALEIAIVAGLAARLGAGPDAMAQAEEWRDGPGRELIDGAFAELDHEELEASIDGLIDADVDRTEIEEALFDVDEIAAAAEWTGHQKTVRPTLQRIADTIRSLPDPFAPVADLGAWMSRMPAVATAPDLYGFWLAVADAAEWAEE